MQVIGDIGGGKFGVMSKDQIVAWLGPKDNRQLTKSIKSSLKTCVEGLQSDTGGATDGGNNMENNYHGLPMRHTSKGAKSNEGMTLFYVSTQAGIAKIIGMGYHVGAQTYELTWTEGGWRGHTAGDKISLD